MEEHEELVNHPQIAINNQTSCVIEPDVPKCEVRIDLCIYKEKKLHKIEHALIHLRYFLNMFVLNVDGAMHFIYFNKYNTNSTEHSSDVN